MCYLNSSSRIRSIISRPRHSITIYYVFNNLSNITLKLVFGFLQTVTYFATLQLPSLEAVHLWNINGCCVCTCGMRGKRFSKYILLDSAHKPFDKSECSVYCVPIWNYGISSNNAISFSGWICSLHNRLKLVFQNQVVVICAKFDFIISF